MKFPEPGGYRWLGSLLQFGVEALAGADHGNARLRPLLRQIWSCPEGVCVEQPRRLQYNRTLCQKKEEYEQRLVTFYAGTMGLPLPEE